MACGGCGKTRLKNIQVKVPYNTKGTYLPKIKTERKSNSKIRRK
jgi:hypothetical protein